MEEKIDKKFIHRYNLYLEAVFLKTFQKWKIEPNISFLRLLKETMNEYDLWSFENISREQLLAYMTKYMQVSFLMQSCCYSYEIIKDGGLNQSSQNLKNNLKQIKAKIDVDNIEKTTNALQLVKIIREAFAHNNDSEEISNWSMDEEFYIHIQSKRDKAGNRHNIKLSFDDLTFFIDGYLANILNVDETITELYVNGNQLDRKISKQRLLTPEQMSKHIKKVNSETQEYEKCSELQLNALCHCFNNDFFHGELVERISSPYRPNFISMVFPFEFNCHNMLYDLKLMSNGLFHLNYKYRSLEEWFNSILNQAKNAPDMTCEYMTYLFYFFSSGKADSAMISNILFSIFSFENFENVKNLFSDTGLDINRIRNSVMHGRFYYNYKNEFDFYDGKHNSDLEYIGSLKVKKITEVAQTLMLNYSDELKSGL